MPIATKGGKPISTLAFLAELLGISEAQALWQYNRARHLMHTEKLSREEAKVKIAEESKSKPWETK